MIRYWVFDQAALDAALDVWRERLALDNGAAATLAVDVVRSFLASREAHAHKMLIDREEAAHHAHQT